MCQFRPDWAGCFPQKDFDEKDLSIGSRLEQIFSITRARVAGMAVGTVQEEVVLSQVLTKCRGDWYFRLMSTFNMLEAKTNFSSLVARAERGEEIVIARAGKPVARIVPINDPPRREFDFLDLGPIPDSAFFDPLPDEELASWE